MLRLDQIDMDMLETALEFQSDFGSSWWLDPETGELLLLTGDYSDDDDVTADDLDARGALRVEPLSSWEGYGLMETFIDGVGDKRAADRLSRAITGKGAFRRFKDTLGEFPELREEWFDFHDRAIRRRAIEWLVDEGIVAPVEARKALDALEE